MVVLTAIAAPGRRDSVLAHTTPITCDGGAGSVRGRYVPGGEWHVGGWAGPRREVDADALKRYMAAIPRRSVYLSNAYEDTMWDRIPQLVQVLAAAHARPLTVGLFSFPGLPAEGSREANDRMMAAIGPHVDMICPGVYFAEAGDAMTDLERWQMGAMLDESVRLAAGRKVVPVLRPETHHGVKVPVSKTIELAAMCRARGVDTCAVWTDGGYRRHVGETVKALRKA